MPFAMENTEQAEVKYPAKEDCPKCGKRAGLPITRGMPTDPDDEDYYYVSCCTIIAPRINMGCTKCGHKWHSSI